MLPKIFLPNTEQVQNIFVQCNPAQDMFGPKKGNLTQE